MSKNQLKFLTEDFCNLVNLKHLDLYNNQLENLPVNFGKLNKLRYLDLKGNPLQPALLKIVGPCLTSKDCLDAAKKIVPFMTDLEIKFRAEQLKREDEELKRREEEDAEIREQARLAKKAARKERVMRERQEKSETENLIEEPATKRTQNELKPSISKATSNKSIKSSSNSFLSFVKTFVFVMIMFVIVFVLFLKFLPDQSDRVLSLLPQQQQNLLRYTFEKIDGSVLSIYKKVLNLYKM